MAEQPTDIIHQPSADEKEETQLNMDHVSDHDGYKPEETDTNVNVKPPEATSSSVPTNKETKSESSEDLELAEVENIVPAEEKKGCPTEESSTPDTENSTPPQTDDGGQGDGIRETSRNEQLTMTGKNQTGEKAETEAAKGDKVDGLKFNEESPGTGNTNTEAEEDDEKVSFPREEERHPEEDTTSPQTALPSKVSVQEELCEQRKKVEKVSAPKEEQDPEEDTTSRQTALPRKVSVEEELCEQRKKVETIGPTPQETTGPAGILGGNRRYLIVVGVVVLAVLMQHLFHTESPPQKNDEQQIDIFLRQMEKVVTKFPNQRADLWKRSRIHLLRHLQTSQPTEPVSLILTAGLRAERTLHCLAQGLASAFSSAHNASVLHIDGASKASQDSDQVKLDIDSNLQGAFEGDKPVAVIHRFEELPPGSTLIFYRYCDHENAAYKKTCLIFTVLLDEEEEIPAMSRLSTVEEMVDDHLQKKFLSGSHPVSYDRMDLDKYGGLWSRISHLILPVVAEERIEHEGC
uniref:torsin-1A-interacting protein 2-like n=1 Tax=Semicossyphus pulcher TaxID=241346 RepID=UPI0037E8C79D